MKNPGNIDWNVLKRYTSPQAVKEFDRFLDALPLNVGPNALIAIGMAWLIAGLAVVFTSTEVENVSKIRTELAKVEALKPPIPVVQYTPVPEPVLKELEKKISDTYKGVAFSGTASALAVSAQDTDYFPQFLAALNTLQNGGKNWRTSIVSMCAGRDCSASKLSATMKIEEAKVGEATADDSKEKTQ